MLVSINDAINVHAPIPLVIVPTKQHFPLALAAFQVPLAALVPEHLLRRFARNPKHLHERLALILGRLGPEFTL